MRSVTLTLATIASAAILMTSSAVTAVAQTPPPPVSGCYIATNDDPANRDVGLGAGYLYRLEVKLRRPGIRPVAGGCSTTYLNDQLGLIVSGPTKDGWQCVYGLPNGSNVPSIRITATVVGCAGVADDKP